MDQVLQNALSMLYVYFHLRINIDQVEWQNETSQMRLTLPSWTILALDFHTF